MLTRVPAAIARLVEIFTAATDAKVLDGPTVGEPPRRAVLVGGNWRGAPAYSATVTRQQGFSTTLREDWEIRCFATVQLTTDSFPDARNAVADLLAVCDAAVRASVTCEAWDTAAITGNVEWVPELTKIGAACSLVFTVNGAGLL